MDKSGLSEALALGGWCCRWIGSGGKRKPLWLNRLDQLAQQNAFGSCHTILPYGTCLSKLVCIMWKKNINFIVFWCNIFEEVNCLLVIWAIPITLYLAANLSLISTILSLFLVGEHKILAVFCMQFLTFQVIHLTMMPIAILRNKKKNLLLLIKEKYIYISQS